MRTLLIGLFLLGVSGWAFQESFTDITFPPVNWTTVNADSGTRFWQRLDIGSHTEPGCAYCGWEGSYLRNNDWLITPQCSVKAGDRFSFFYRAQDEAFYESLEVRVSTASPRLADFELIDAFGTDSVFYQFRDYDLSQYAGKKIFLATVYRSFNKYGVMIDDVSGPEEWFPSHDVGVSKIWVPPVYLRVGKAFQPACWVRNLTEAGEWFKVSYEILGFWQEDTWVGVAPMDSILVSFPKIAIWHPDTYQIVFATHLDSDQRRWNDTLSEPLVVSPFQSRGGPDSTGYGYVWFDSDDPFGPEYNWQEISQSGTLLGWGDDTLYRLDLSWQFPFYGKEYSICYVSTNGWLSFAPPRPLNSADSNLPIPHTAHPDRLLASFWDNLEVKGNEGGIWYKYYGDTLLVIEWFRARCKGCQNCSLNFEVKLFRSGVIEFHYAGVNAGDWRYYGGRSATVGIEDASGRVGLQYLYNGSPPGNILSPGRAIRFLPLVVGVEEPFSLLEKGWRFSVLTGGGEVILKLFSPEASGGRLLIYDVQGRVVRRLFNGNFAAGEHKIVWDGTDDNARRIPKGVYFIRFDARGISETKKAVLLK